MSSNVDMNANACAVAGVSIYQTATLEYLQFSKRQDEISFVGIFMWRVSRILLKDTAHGHCCGV